MVRRAGVHTWSSRAGPEGGKTALDSIHDPDLDTNLDRFTKRIVRAGKIVTKGVAPSAWSAARRYAVLSIAAAVLTIGLKAAAYLVTGSVGLFSDTAESVATSWRRWQRCGR